MRDLAIFVRELLVSDEVLKELFRSAEFDKVSVIHPHERSTASYPCVILEHEESSPMKFGENAPSPIRNGRLIFEIVAATNEDLYIEAPMMRLDISDRCREILTGEGDKTTPVQGQCYETDKGVNWSISECTFLRERSLYNDDPNISRGQLVFEMQIIRDC